MGVAGEPEILAGPVEPDVEFELAGLALRYADVAGGARRSPRSVRDRLARSADRISGAQAVTLRHRPIPWAYRVCFRHIGLDPDEQRTPVEELTFERIAGGGLGTRGLPDDALVVATLESHVALRALDAGALSEPLGVRTSREGELIEGRRVPLPAGTLVLADASRIVATLFGPPVASVAVGKRTERTRICALGVAGVPSIAIEEAIWVATEMLAG